MKQKCVGKEAPVSTGPESHPHSYSFFTNWTSYLFAFLDKLTFL